MKVAIFCLIGLAALIVLFNHPPARSPGEPDKAVVSLPDRELPMRSLDITDYSVEFRQSTSNQTE